MYPRLKGESTQTNVSLTKWVIPLRKDLPPVFNGAVKGRKCSL